MPERRRPRDANVGCEEEAPSRTCQVPQRGRKSLHLKKSRADTRLLIKVIKVEIIKKKKRFMNNLNALF